MSYEFSFTNSQANILDATAFKGDTILCTLDGKIDLTNPQAKDFRLSRFTRGPILQLITTGSNMRFH